MSDDGLHFLVNVTGAGYHRAAWLDPDVPPGSFIDVGYYQGVAETAERGLFDALLLPDIPQQNAGIATGPTQSLEPTLLCTALAVTTERVGFIPTLSTSFNRPYNLARRVLSLDHASNGRGGWNVVTTAAPGAAANFGQEVLPREDRYRRAAEFVDLANRLWDGWEDGALVGDQQSGEFADPAKIHPAAHHGEFFDVEGPLNVPRSPQGRPVIVQAGASDPGIRFAATHAEVVYGAQLSLPGAAEFARHIAGGHRLVIGSTQQVADHIEEWWRAGAVDGFTIAPPALAHDLQSFVDLVVPELQRRGIYRDRYPGRTLRANLGLPVPANPFAALVDTAK